MKSIMSAIILAGMLVISPSSSASDLPDSVIKSRAPYSFPSGIKTPFQLPDEKLQLLSTDNSASPTNETEFSIIGNKLWSRTHNLISDSNYLYCALPYGIIIYDISDPLNLVEVSRLFLGGAWDMVKQGHYLYVVSGHDNTFSLTQRGLRIVDISDILNPTIVYKYKTFERARSVTINGNRAYISTAYKDLLAFDITDPPNSFLIGDLGTVYNHPASITVRDTLVFMGFYDGIRVVSVADPANMYVIISGSVGLNVDQIELQDSLLYYLTIASFGALNVANLPNLSLVGVKSAAPLLPLDFELNGNRAYAGAFSAELIIYDISNPSNPTTLGSYNSSGLRSTHTSVTYSNGYAFLADSSAIRVIDVTNESAPQEVETVNLDGAPYAATVSGGFAYTGGSDGLQITHLNATNGPEIIGAASSYDRIHDIEIAGDYAYAADSDSGMLIYNIANPFFPSLIGRYDSPGRALGLQVKDSLVFLCDSDSLIIINAADRTNPVRISAVKVPLETFDVDIFGDYAYVGTYSLGFAIVDISDIMNPTYKQSVDVGSYYFADIVVRNGLLFVSISKFHNSEFLYIFDLVDPLSPIQLSATIIPNSTFTYSISLDGDYAYIASVFRGVTSFNISNPSSPWVSGTVETPGTCAGVGAGNGKVVVADQMGLLFLETSPGFICGNIDNSPPSASPIDISDLTYLIKFLFDDGPPPVDMGSSNVDGIGSIDIGDLTYLIGYLFIAGPPPIC